MIAAAGACCLPFVTPPIALAGGMVLALFGLTSRTKQATKIAKYLIQVAVVLLGLGMDLHQVAKAGMVGFAFAAGTIVGTFALGAVLGKWLKTERTVTTLLSSGTAICGGSAIAATASVIGATEAQIAVAMGAVFLLNAIAIYIFPYIGELLHMSQEQFGTWAAVAIHDVANVVGAAASFDRSAARAGNVLAHPHLATETATAVKLTRTLWIAPVVMVCAWWFARLMRDEARLDPGSSGSDVPTKAKAKIPVPWFVLWFVVAATIGTLLPQVHDVAEIAGKIAKEKLMTIALLLIGCGLSIGAIKSVGWRAMVLAVVLWVAISTVALVVVRGV